MRKVGVFIKTNCASKLYSFLFREEGYSMQAFYFFIIQIQLFFLLSEISYNLVTNYVLQVFYQIASIYSYKGEWAFVVNSLQ